MGFFSNKQHWSIHSFNYADICHLALYSNKNLCILKLKKILFYLEKEQINTSTKKPRCHEILTKTLIKSELFLYSKPRDEISNEDCIVEKLIENVMNWNRSNQFLSTQIIDKRYERNCTRSLHCSLWHTRFVPGSLTQRQVYTKYPNCVFKWKLFKRQVILNKKNYFKEKEGVFCCFF